MLSSFVLFLHLALPVGDELPKSVLGVWEIEQVEWLQEDGSTRNREFTDPFYLILNESGYATAALGKGDRFRYLDEVTISASVSHRGKIYCVGQHKNPTVRCRLTLTPKVGEEAMSANVRFDFKLNNRYHRLTFNYQLKLLEKEQIQEVLERLPSE